MDTKIEHIAKVPRKICVHLPVTNLNTLSMINCTLMAVDSITRNSCDAALNNWTGDANKEYFIFCSSMILNNLVM